MSNPGGILTFIGGPEDAQRCFMLQVTTEGERFSEMLSVDDSKTPPVFKLGPLHRRTDLPEDVALFTLDPARDESN